MLKIIFHFKWLKCKEKPQKPPNQNLKSMFNLMSNTQNVPQHTPLRPVNISVTSKYCILNVPTYYLLN